MCWLHDNMTFERNKRKWYTRSKDSKFAFLTYSHVLCTTFIISIDWLASDFFTDECEKFHHSNSSGTRHVCDIVRLWRLSGLNDLGCFHFGWRTGIHLFWCTSKHKWKAHCDRGSVEPLPKLFYQTASRRFWKWISVSSDYLISSPTLGFHGLVVLISR